MARPKKERPNSRGLYEVKKPVIDPDTGRKIYKSFTSTISKAEAQKKYEDYKIKLAVKHEQIVEEYETITFKTVAETVLELKKGTIKDNTWDTKWRNIFENYLIPHFGNKQIKHIRKNDIELYIKSKSSEFTKSTLQVHLQDLNAVFRSAVENGIINRNPCEFVKVREGNKSAEKQVYTPEQAEYVLEYCKIHELGLATHLLLQYGLSRSELLALTWNDVDYDKRIIRIDKGLTEAKGGAVIDDPKNRFRNRIVPISDTTIELLKKNDTGTEYVIANVNGGNMLPSNWYHRVYMKFMKDMQAYYNEKGIEVPILHPHELRHTRASIWVNEGKNLYAIAEIMGWADLDMLRKRYAHGDITELRNLIDL